MVLNMDNVRQEMPNEGPILNIKDTLKAFDDFRNKQKNLYSNVFWNVKNYVYSESVLITLYIEIKHKKMFKKISFGQNK